MVVMEAISIDVKAMMFLANSVVWVQKKGL
jgi:hypothetical protein